jgi:hypothetical protein
MLARSCPMGQRRTRGPRRGALAAALRVARHLVGGGGAPGRLVGTVRSPHSGSALPGARVARRVGRAPGRGPAGGAARGPPRGSRRTRLDDPVIISTMSAVGTGQDNKRRASQCATGTRAKGGEAESPGGRPTARSPRRTSTPRHAPRRARQPPPCRHAVQNGMQSSWAPSPSPASVSPSPAPSRALRATPTSRSLCRTWAPAVSRLRRRARRSKDTATVIVTGSDRFVLGGYVRAPPAARADALLASSEMELELPELPKSKEEVLALYRKARDPISKLFRIVGQTLVAPIGAHASPARAAPPARAKGGHWGLCLPAGDADSLSPQHFRLFLRPVFGAYERLREAHGGGELAKHVAP